MSKTQIVIDADVIIHFSKGGMLSRLPDIFPEYEFIVLGQVYKEIINDIKIQLDNQISLLKNITCIDYKPKGAEMLEYANLLKANLGKGESACMIYCRFNNNVVGSSNLNDIAKYCATHKITYLTTLDFLYYAIKKGIITVVDANSFIQEVISKGSKLPTVDMGTYICKTQM